MSGSVLPEGWREHMVRTDKGWRPKHAMDEDEAWTRALREATAVAYECRVCRCWHVGHVELSKAKARQTARRVEMDRRRRDAERRRRRGDYSLDERAERARRKSANRLEQQRQREAGIIKRAAKAARAQETRRQARADRLAVSVWTDEGGALPPWPFD